MYTLEIKTRYDRWIQVGHYAQENTARSLCAEQQSKFACESRVMQGSTVIVHKVPARRGAGK